MKMHTPNKSLGPGPDVLSDKNLPSFLNFSGFGGLNVDDDLNDCYLHTAFDDPGGNRVASESGGVVDVEFGHEVFPMLFDGLDANAKVGGSFFVGFAFGDQL